MVDAALVAEAHRGGRGPIEGGRGPIEGGHDVVVGGIGGMIDGGCGGIYWEAEEELTRQQAIVLAGSSCL